MNTLKREIQEINQETIALVKSCTDVEIQSSLGASLEVAGRLSRAGEAGLQTAITCGQPLAMPNIAGIRTALSTTTSSSLSTASGWITKWRFKILLLIQRTTLVDPALAILWFDLPPALLDRIQESTLGELEVLAASAYRIIELRQGGNSRFWWQLLVGDLIADERSTRITQAAALLHALA